jgi:hypothetical protein
MVFALPHHGWNWNRREFVVVKGVLMQLFHRGLLLILRVLVMVSVF